MFTIIFIVIIINNHIYIIEQYDYQRSRNVTGVYDEQSFENFLLNRLYTCIHELHKEKSN